MHADDDSRRLLDKLIRETARAEAQIGEHVAREMKRIGPTPPVLALAAVSDHAAAMHARFSVLLDGYGVDTQLARSSLGSTLSTLRHLVVDRMIHAERAYRTALLDLRHGIEIVKLLREIVRARELFGLIRWCDDWLGARRTLVARVEAQLAWFAEQELLAPEAVSAEDRDDDFETLSNAPE